MRFSWKICFATILISLTILSAGGYVLISALFQSTFERDVENALEENQMLQYSFVAYWNTTVQEAKVTDENIQKAGKAMLQNMKGSRIRILDAEKYVLLDNSGADKDTGLLEQVNDSNRGYSLRETAQGYDIQTVSVIEIDENEVLYLESFRDVTQIFEERDHQYDIYRLWMLGILALESICCFAMALWMLRPLKHLSETTGKIAEGQLDVRAEVTAKDEFGELADSFNAMADSLERQVQELEMSAKRQEDFIGSFAHELKTPMTSMIGYADMLRSREMSEEERFQAANYIFKEGKRLEALSLKLLELLVVRRGELEKRNVPVKWLAEDIEGILRPMLETSDVTLLVQVEEAVLLIEPDLMKTVLLNLLDNGRKAIEGEGVIQLTGEKEEGGYVFYIKDSGKGMARSELARITEAFYRIDKSRAREKGGAGLGLSICAEIIERHNGCMEFQSEEGKGTAVRIFLPEEAMK